MRTFAQIVNGKVHWLCRAEQRPEFAPNIVLVDITDVAPQPQEGWSYDAETGTFAAPPAAPPIAPLSPLAELRQQNLMALEAIATLYETITGGGA